jgi:excisionase family DNA binding protein
MEDACCSDARVPLPKETPPGNATSGRSLSFRCRGSVMVDKLVLTVLEAAEVLRCSRTRVFQLLADGTLVRARRYGRQTVIIAESVYQALEVPSPAPLKPKRVRKRGPLQERLRQAWINAQEPR